MLAAAFEWPRCALGWTISEIESLLRVLLHRVLFDGCSHGLCVRKGLPLFKEWRIQTNLDGLPCLEAHCLRNHTRGEVRGVEARNSASYTPALAYAVFQALVCSTSAKPVPHTLAQVEPQLVA